MPAMTSCLISVDDTVAESVRESVSVAKTQAGDAKEVVRPKFVRIYELTDRALRSINRNDGVTPGALIDLVEARDIAMANIVSAPGPEFAVFGELAQHLGHAVDRINSVKMEAHKD